jgi:hypothetical protein
VIHDHYRDTTEAQGRDPALEPAGRPWETLDTSYRDASRQQADHLWAKLADSDCRSVPLEEAPAFAFAPLEVERLAEVEHRRWAADRYLNGWTYAAVRDNVRRHHPQLVPYAELSEPMKDLDRYVVRLVPTLLTRSGRALVRGLVVGVAEADPPARSHRRTRGLVDACLLRLAERFPDHALVGRDLRHLFHLVARAWIVWRLCGCSPSQCPTCWRPPDPLARDLLRLAARAERRIGLRGREELADWLGTRAQVLILPAGTAPQPAPARQVQLDPAGKGLTWSFEY